MKRYWAVFIFWILPGYIFAQYQNVWTFGEYAGIDFNTLTPMSITTGMRVSEGCSSICDETGKLLFYTDGNTVWSADHNEMPNGKDIVNGRYSITYSTTQGALITPVPGKKQQYYIFSLGQMGLTPNASPDFGKLYYSTIDMSLNNGLGDISTKGNLLDSLLTEHMAAVCGNDCNIWLLALSRSDTTFKAYRIDANGINRTPVVSPRIGGFGIYWGMLGCIAVSPDRSKLAIVHGNIILYDFDVNTGKITQPLILERSGDYYGVCFSPDNTKLYGNTLFHINQFDLNLDSTNATIRSKTDIAKDAKIGYCTIKNGPDGKMYCSSSQDSFLNVIHNPNLAGDACNFQERGLILSPQTRSVLGLPNNVATRQFFHTTTDTAFCTNSFTLRANTPSGSKYIWDDGSNKPTRVIHTSGIYWVRYRVISSCSLDEYDEYIDTFSITFDSSLKNVYTTTEQSGMCGGDTLLIVASNLNGLNYIWEDGSIGKERKVNRAGVYRVNYQVDSLCRNYTDTYRITYPDKPYKVAFEADSIICTDNVISFRNTSDNYYTNFSWSFGDGGLSSAKDTTYTFIRPGSYKVMLIGAINEWCRETAYQTITVDAPVEELEFESDKKEICTGEKIQYRIDSFEPLFENSTLTALQWQLDDNYTLVSRNATVNHAYDKAGIFPVVLTARFRACPEVSFTDSIKVHALPLVAFGSDSVICLRHPYLILENQHTDKEAYNYQWNTGSDDSRLKITHPGRYSLTVTDRYGCSGTEWVTISKDCYIDIPNTFTPNGDGYNDYFFPRQLLSQQMAAFKMQVFDRWGSLVFSTLDKNGRGWDGRLNGRDLSEGVYTYIIEVAFREQGKELYSGNVTLLR